MLLLTFAAFLLALRLAQVSAVPALASSLVPPYNAIHGVTVEMDNSREGNTQVAELMLAKLMLAVVAAFVAAAAFFPALRLGRWKRLAVFFGLCMALLLSPLLIPPPKAPFLRFLASVVAVLLLVKLYDLHVAACRGSRPSLRTFLQFLPNPFYFVLRSLPSQRQPSRRRNLLDLARGIMGAAIGIAVLIWLFGLDWEG